MGIYVVRRPLLRVGKKCAYPFDANTVSLLHMNGADGSTTFTDESGKTWTAHGNAKIDTAQSVFGGAAGLFDGTGDYITSPDSDDWRLDGGSNSNAWTIDFRVRFNTDPSGTFAGIISQRADNSNFWALTYDSTTIRFLVKSGGVNIIDKTQAWNPSSSTWYHVAVVKNGTAGYMFFVDGTQLGSTSADSDVIPDFSGEIMIGRYIASDGTPYYLDGRLDEFRASKGDARWTEDFTPPTQPYCNP